MREFDAISDRFKRAVGVTTDKEVAQLLGMKVNAFHARKQRDSFPSELIYVLARKMPELKLEPEYIVTGIEHTDGASTLGSVREIDPELKAEVLMALKSEKPMFGTDPLTRTAIDLFVNVYNSVCHLEAGSDRRISARKNAALILANLDQDFRALLNELEGQDAKKSQKVEKKG